MKKVIYFIAAALMVVSFVSCSDMLDSKSDRYVYDPALDQKVDSMFYINGILKGVQQAIDTAGHRRRAASRPWTVCQHAPCCHSRDNTRGGV